MSVHIRTPKERKHDSPYALAKILKLFPAQPIPRHSRLNYMSPTALLTGTWNLLLPLKNQSLTAMTMTASNNGPA